MEERLGNMRDEEKLGGCSCRFHGSSGGHSRGGCCFVLADTHFALLFYFIFFVLEITLHFIYIKIFFYIVCVLYVLYL